MAVENGLQEIEMRLEFDWFEGQQLPTFLKAVVIEEYEISGNQRNYRCLIIYKINTRNFY